VIPSKETAEYANLIFERLLNRKKTNREDARNKVLSIPVDKFERVYEELCDQQERRKKH